MIMFHLRLIDTIEFQTYAHKLHKFYDTYYTYIEYIPFKLFVKYMGQAIHNNPHRMAITWYYDKRELDLETDKVHIDHEVDGKTTFEQNYELHYQHEWLYPLEIQEDEDDNNDQVQDMDTELT